jgi:hypothetical protein
MLWASLLALASFAARVVQKEPARSVVKFPEVFPKATAFQAMALRPPAASAARITRSVPPLAQLQSDDGEEVDWDREMGKLANRFKPQNPYVKEMSETDVMDLVQEFAATAPKPVQFAVTATVASLLGKLPDQIMEQEITTTGKALGSLLFNMQMTGYMFRNAEYRRSLMQSMKKASLPAGNAQDPENPTQLPAVSGTVTVTLWDGTEAEVEAEAYMAELRKEVEELRSQLVARGDAVEGDEALITYIQALEQDDRESLMQDVSEDILEAMSQLVAKLLADLNIERDQMVAANAEKLRELLVLQLISGYKLRELQVMENLKDNYWGPEGENPAE